jgi:hypothetical protein
MRFASDNRLETFEQWRQRMLDETGRFIEWGLAHPDQVDWIPRHPVRLGGFSERMKTVFWGIVWSRKDWPE